MLHRVAIKEREEIKGMTRRKMARRHNNEGGKPPGTVKQKTTMEDIDEGYNLSRRMGKA